MAYITDLDIDSLIADTENPRFEPVSNEVEAFYAILDNQQTKSGNKVLVLARSIAAEGLNPAESLVVSPIEDDDHYLVREGNRRVTAIKLALYPALVPDKFAALREGFAELGEAMESQRRISCYVTENDDEIRSILQRRHDGEMGGAGLVRWDSEQRARFSQGGNTQAQRAIAFVDELRKKLGDDEIVEVAGSIPATNLGRLINTPEVRNALGIKAVGGAVHYSGGHDDVLLDVLTTVRDEGLSCINRKEDRIKLVSEASKRHDSLPVPSQGSLELLPETSALEKDYGADNGLGKVDDISTGSTGGHDGIDNSTNVVGLTTADEDSATPSTVHLRSRPVPNHSNDPMFGTTLRPRGESSNSIYRAIKLIDELYLRKGAEYAYVLPVLGFSMRLLLETVAREYFAAQDPSVDYADNSLKRFLDDVAKPLLKTKLDSGEMNSYSLGSEWVSGKYNLNAILSKWAHGTMNVDRGSLVQQSQLVALIINELWS